MKRTLFLSLLFAAVVADACKAKDPVILVPEKDPEMDAAIAEARTSIETFISALEHPQAGDDYFSVKVPIKDQAQVEHFWLADVRHVNGVFTGTLDNDPQLVKGHRAGEAVSVAKAEISDWMFVRQGILQGGTTIRVLRKRMTPEEQKSADRDMPFRFE